jgi:hypothetical protein
MWHEEWYFIVIFTNTQKIRKIVLQLIIGFWEVQILSASVASICNIELNYFWLWMFQIIPYLCMLLVFIYLFILNICTVGTTRKVCCEPVKSQCLILMMEAAGYSEMLVANYRTMWCYATHDSLIINYMLIWANARVHSFVGRELWVM